MGLGACWRIEIGVKCAIISFTIEFNKIGRVENGISLTLHENGLLCSTMKEINASWIERGNGDACRQQVGMRQAVNTIFCYWYFVVGLSKIDPFIGELSIRRLG